MNDLTPSLGLIGSGAVFVAVLGLWTVRKQVVRRRPRGSLSKLNLKTALQKAPLS